MYDYNINHFVITDCAGNYSTFPYFAIWENNIKTGAWPLWFNLVVASAVFKVTSEQAKKFSTFWLIKFAFKKSMISSSQTKWLVIPTSKGSVKHSSSSFWNVLLFLPLAYTVDTKKVGPLILSTLMVINFETLVVFFSTSFTSKSSLTQTLIPPPLPCRLQQTISRYLRSFWRKQDVFVIQPSFG